MVASASRRRYCLNENWETPVYLHQATYDSLGRPTATTDSLASTRQWGYDRKSQLVGAVTTNSAALPYSYAYAYDSIGNRLTTTENAANATYAANRLNQYTVILRDSVSSCEPTYDADGNLTQDERHDYVYDCENRLVSVTPRNPSAGDAFIENVYDHRSRRIRKIVRHYTGNAWTAFEARTFVWDNWNVVLEEIVRANNTTNRIEYFWGNDLSGSEQGAGGVGGLLAVRQDGVFYIPVYDGSANIVMYVSETGTVSARSSTIRMGRSCRCLVLVRVNFHSASRRNTTIARSDSFPTSCVSTIQPTVAGSAGILLRRPAVLIFITSVAIRHQQPLMFLVC